jgi:MFS family permease
MSTRTETRVIQLAAVAQGVALVTFPAASTIFTDPSKYDLSRSEYGLMFVPQAVTAVLASLLGASWARSAGTRRIYLLGLTANLGAMALLVASATVQHHGAVVYPLLLLATASLGIGFGFTVPAINTLTAAFHPEGVDRAVLVLNALLGVGTALAPLLVAIFDGLDFWWGLPLLAGAVLAVLIGVSARLPFRVAAPADAATPRRARIPTRFWLFAAFAVCYGICETMNGNWASLDMKDLGASTAQASFALTTFWAMVTVGRVAFSAMSRRVSSRVTYRVLPLVLVATFVAISQLPDDQPALAVVAFGIAGLGCSALLPLTISFGQAELTSMGAAVAGSIIASYQIGYGIAAFGAGPLQTAGLDLGQLYAITAVIAAIMGALAFAVSAARGARTAVPDGGSGRIIPHG